MNKSANISEPARAMRNQLRTGVVDKTDEKGYVINVAL